MNKEEWNSFFYLFLVIGIVLVGGIILNFLCGKIGRIVDRKLKEKEDKG